MMEWLGAGFDPEAYDADEANACARAQMARVTEVATAQGVHGAGRLPGMNTNGALTR